MSCVLCKKELSFNEMGLNRKYNPCGGQLCKGCLAQKLGVERERLDEKIAEFLRAGCLYFAEEN